MSTSEEKCWSRAQYVVEIDRLRAENGDHLAWIEHLKAELAKLRAEMGKTNASAAADPE